MPFLSVAPGRPTCNAIDEAGVRDIGQLALEQRRQDSVTRPARMRPSPTGPGRLAHGFNLDVVSNEAGQARRARQRCPRRASLGVLQAGDRHAGGVRLVKNDFGQFRVRGQPAPILRAPTVPPRAPQSTFPTITDRCPHTLQTASSSPSRGSNRARNEKVSVRFRQAAPRRVAI
jgi:hypothetical protein